MLRNKFLRNSISLWKICQSEQTLNPLKSNVLMELILNCSGMKDRKFVPSPVKVALRKTDVEIWLPSLTTRVSRNGRELSFSCSTVNFMFLCLEFR